MRFFGFIVFFSQFVNAEPIKQAELWSECVQSYKSSKAAFFDVAFNENDPQKHLIFRNGKYVSPEALNIYHNGQFWTSEIKVEEGFYEKKNALVIIGTEKFCLKQEFNWVRSDKLSLEPFNEKVCTSAITYTMNLSKSDAKPNAEDVLLLKLSKDVKLALNCMSKKREAGCQVTEKQAAYQRLSKWNTQICEKIENVKLKELIAEKKRVYSEYISEIKPEDAAAEVKKDAAPADKKSKKLN